MKALIVCAEQSDSVKIRTILKSIHIKADACDTYGTAVQQIKKTKYGLYVLDLAADGIGGIEFCRMIRAKTNAPVIFLSKNFNEAEEVAGFEAGADDYLMKPFGLLEVSSRVRAILRRCGSPVEYELDWLDAKTRTANIDGRIVKLTPMEFNLLSALAEANGAIVPKNDLIREVWGADSYATDDALKVRINSLRKKIGEKRVENVRGYGYRLVPEI